MFTEEQTKKLEKELQAYNGFLSFTSDAILDQDVSRYPIFILHLQGINVGIPLDTDHIQGNWLVNASSLEEFVTKQLIESSKVDAFTAVYKDPKHFLCLFVVDSGSATFVFIPRK
ncbi:MAG: hypothetical protein ACI8P3_001333 [Saprospiraceae bacterium]|jgi:hypothetical protein